MGDLIRFPGALVDYDFLDAFEWTDELLREYELRARELAARYGSNTPTRVARENSHPATHPDEGGTHA